MGPTERIQDALQFGIRNVIRYRSRDGYTSYIAPSTMIAARKHAYPDTTERSNHDDEVMPSTIACGFVCPQSAMDHWHRTILSQAHSLWVLRSPGLNARAARRQNSITSNFA
jgi:hypothetical protein